MQNRQLPDHDLESLRRSLAMLQTNQLALTRDQGIDLLTELLATRQRIRELDTRHGEQHPGTPHAAAGSNRPRRA